MDWAALVDFYDKKEKNSCSLCIFQARVVSDAKTRKTRQLRPYLGNLNGIGLFSREKPGNVNKFQQLCQ